MLCDRRRRPWSATGYQVLLRGEDEVPRSGSPIGDLVTRSGTRSAGPATQRCRQAPQTVFRSGLPDPPKGGGLGTPLRIPLYKDLGNPLRNKELRQAVQSLCRSGLPGPPPRPPPLGGPGNRRTTVCGACLRSCAVFRSGVPSPFDLIRRLCFGPGYRWLQAWVARSLCSGCGSLFPRRGPWCCSG